MATPTDSTTTFSGKRCTRTRVRTATSILSSQAAEVTPTDFTSSSTSDLQQLQTSAAAASSSVAPPASSVQQQPPVVASSSNAAVSSAIGTSSPVSSAAQSSLLANVVTSIPAAVVPDPGAVVSAAAVATTQVPSSLSTLLSTASTTDSDVSDAAATTVSFDPSPASQSSSPTESSTDAGNAQSDLSTPTALPSDQQPNSQPAQATSTLSSGGAAGVISPEQGGGDGNSLTIGSGPNTNVGSIVGGVIGGVAGIAMISIFLFWCLRKRKSREPFEKWQKRVSEKDEDSPGLLVKLKVIPEKLRAVPAGIGLLVGKIKGKRSGSAQNLYNRQTIRSSVSSVYSSRSVVRSRSVSEPPSKLRQQLRGFGSRMPSLKRSRSLLQKKQDSLVVGAKSPFPGIVEDPVIRSNKGVENPFADPTPLEPPKTLQVLNPDPNSRQSTPKPDAKSRHGLEDQQRGPVAPKRATVSDRGSTDPFASMLDELDERDGSGTPEWLKDTTHRRSQSAATALRSHPPSSYTASVYTNADNPFFDPTDIPPVPRQPLPPNPPKRPSNAYTALPTFNATSSVVSRESDVSFFFGEPGPSRPTTNMFSQASPMPRLGRQSDPFDLEIDRIGFGNVAGRREVRGSVTQQNSKSNRTSTIPNWVSVDDGPYGRASAMPGPLRNPSIKR